MQLKSVKYLPWGDEVHCEIPLHDKGDRVKFYARHGKTADGIDYIDFTKFGPVEGKEYETYTQKLRLFSADEWDKVQNVVAELMESAGWNV